jgi:hypothetical protein
MATTNNEHPTTRAAERAREAWEAEIRTLAVASIRDDTYRAQAGKAFRVLRPIHSDSR